MTAPHSDSNPLQEAIAAAFSVGSAVFKTASDVAQSASDTLTSTTNAIGEAVIPTAHRLVEQGTETVGNIVTPIAEHPLVQYATKVPGLNWLLAALGQVNIDRVYGDVEKLRQQYPADTAHQLAERIVVDAAMKAAGIGLVTNLVPPIALSLLAVDVAAITALQAEMIYRIAAVYGFVLTEPARRGEVLAIWGLSMGGSNVLKSGLSIVEIIPGIGTVIGASSDAALLYSLGYAACRFYETKIANQNSN